MGGGRREKRVSWMGGGRREKRAGWMGWAAVGEMRDERRVGGGWEGMVDGAGRGGGEGGLFGVV